MKFQSNLTNSTLFFVILFYFRAFYEQFQAIQAKYNLFHCISLGFIVNKYFLFRAEVSNTNQTIYLRGRNECKHYASQVIGDAINREKSESGKKSSGTR